jgi:hypothetical protein
MEFYKSKAYGVQKAEKAKDIGSGFAYVEGTRLANVQHAFA